MVSVLHTEIGASYVAGVCLSRAKLLTRPFSPHPTRIRLPVIICITFISYTGYITGAETMSNPKKRQTETAPGAEVRPAIITAIDVAFFPFDCYDNHDYYFRKRLGQPRGSGDSLWQLVNGLFLPFLARHPSLWHRRARGAVAAAPDSLLIIIDHQVHRGHQHL